MEEEFTTVTGEDLTGTVKMAYLVNMIDGEQYQMSRDDYLALRALLGADKLAGVYIIRPDTSQAVVLTVRNIVTLCIVGVEEEEYDG